MWDGICTSLAKAGAINQQTYAQVIGDFRELGYAGAPERTHGSVQASYLVEKVRALQTADDSAERAARVQRILRKRGVL